MSRLEYNKKILGRLLELVERYPNYRFHQLLMNFSLEVPGQDKFYEESQETWLNFNLDSQSN